MLEYEKKTMCKNKVKKKRKEDKSKENKKGKKGMTERGNR